MTSVLLSLEGCWNSWSLLVKFLVVWLLLEVLWHTIDRKVPVGCVAFVQKLRFWPTIGLSLMSNHCTGNGLWSDVDDTVILGASPICCMVEWLKKANVVAVVNVQMEYLGPVKRYKQLGMKFLHKPTVDHQELLVEELREIVEFVATVKREQPGGKVYIHCKHGHGRSAAAALAWMAHVKMQAGGGRLTEDELQKLNLELLGKRHVRKKMWKQEHLRRFCLNTSLEDASSVTPLLA